MAKTIALCATEDALREPALIGLGGENLEAQEWLATFASGHEARAGIAPMNSIKEVWVSSVYDIEPINLAATLKRDRPEVQVCLCYGKESGSFKSRAHIACIDALLDKSAFIRRYSAAKQEALSSQAAVQAVADSMRAGSADAREVAGAAGAADAGAAAESGVGWRAQSKAEVAAPVAENVDSVSSAPAVAAPPVPPAPAPTATPAAQDGSTQMAPACFFLPIVSGSGGSGKSTVAALAAIFSQRNGYKTVLVDLDLQFGDMRQVLGCADAPSIDQVIDRPDLVESLPTQGDMPALVAAPARMELAERMIPHIPQVLAALSRRFDVIIANTGASWGEQHALMLERASKALFLIEQSASSLRASKHAVDLCGRCGIATSPFVFAVNHFSKSAPLSPIDASCALRGAQAVELADGGRDIEDFISAGCIADLFELDNDFVLSVQEALAGLLPNFAQRDFPDDPRHRSRRLIRRSSKARIRRRRELV